jgi:choline dehydrogenase-like flavoprotein
MAWKREGAAPFHQNRLGRFRRGPAQTYLRQARGRPNLSILTGTLAERVSFSGRRAIGAVLRGASGPIEVRARREVIVACGAIRSPQLLQLSGIGSRHLLDSLGIPVVVACAGVGTNLRDHYSVRVTQRVRGIVTLNERTRGVSLAAGTVQVCARPRPADAGCKHLRRLRQKQRGQVVARSATELRPWKFRAWNIRARTATGHDHRAVPDVSGEYRFGLRTLGGRRAASRDHAALPQRIRRQGMR